MSPDPAAAVGEAVLVLNAGSSSIKVELFAIVDGRPEPRISGQVEGLGAAPRATARDAAGALLVDRTWHDGEGGPASHDAALAIIIDGLDRLAPGVRVVAVGHRVVHGGPDFAAPVAVDDTVMERLKALAPLAPLHQPHNLS